MNNERKRKKNLGKSQSFFLLFVVYILLKKSDKIHTKNELVEIFIFLNTFL